MLASALSLVRAPSHSLRAFPDASIVDGKDKTTEIVFSLQSFRDEDSNIWYTTRRSPPKGATITVHHTCFYEAADGSIERLRATADNSMLQYSFVPPNIDDHRRVDWYRNTFSGILYLIFRGTILGLPEVLRIIADYSVRARAAQYMLACKPSSTKDEIAGGIVNLHQDVWAVWTSFEGIDYIETLTNTEPTSGKYTLLRKKPAEEADVILCVAENHIGVYQIHFREEEDYLLEAQPGVWWRTLRVNKCHRITDAGASSPPGAGQG